MATVTLAPVARRPPPEVRWRTSEKGGWDGARRSVMVLGVSHLLLSGFSASAYRGCVQYNERVLALSAATSALTPNASLPGQSLLSHISNQVPIKFYYSLTSLPFSNTVLVILLSLLLLIPELSVIPSRARFESVHCT
jgi:hypothetical protein